MPTSRVILKRLPTCPGKNARFHIRRNRDQGALWVYYTPRGSSPIPADDRHQDLVGLVNDLKGIEAGQEGGGFSINEHQQVIAHMTAPSGYGVRSIHVIGVREGNVLTYKQTISFENGALSPTLIPGEGDPWPGPLCGMSYRFVARDNPQAPSNNFDEVFAIVGGHILQLSADGGIDPYPPKVGPLADFLAALRRQIPKGGRFRVNEHGRAFTSAEHVFIGIIPKARWFKPLTATS